MNTATQADSTDALPLTLFHVEMPWNPNDSEAGSYGTYVWATSYQSATDQCADMMKDEGAVTNGAPGEADGDSEDDDDSTDHRQYAHLARVDIVVETIVGEAIVLIGGPQHAKTPEAEADFKELERIVRKYAALHAAAQ
jgi:hypothetical protein